jgi:RNA polymerase primary sigma factor
MNTDKSTRLRELFISPSITEREGIMGLLLEEINKIPQISMDEEVELASKIKEGDEKALWRLVEANLRFVVSVSKQYQHQGLSLPDLFSEGFFGLAKAAKKFDPTRGFKFISFAVWWIRQSILAAIAENSRFIRLPSDKFSELNQINKGIIALVQDFERDPTDVEISSSLSLPVEVVKKLKDLSFNISSLDEPVFKDGMEVPVSSLIPDEEKSFYPEIGSMIQSLWDNAERVFCNVKNSRDVEIFKKHLGICGGVYQNPRSFLDIAGDYGITEAMAALAYYRVKKEFTKNIELFVGYLNYL